MYVCACICSFQCLFLKVSHDFIVPSTQVATKILGLYFIYYICLFVCVYCLCRFTVYRACVNILYYFPMLTLRIAVCTNDIFSNTSAWSSSAQIGKWAVVHYSKGRWFRSWKFLSACGSVLHQDTEPKITLDEQTRTKRKWPGKKSCFPNCSLT